MSLPYTQQRKLQRLFSLSLRVSAAKRAQSESRLTKLAFLRSPHMQTLHDLPAAFTQMYNAVSSLPEHDHASVTPPPDPGKRPWETSKTGYLNWAREQLVAKMKEGEGPEGVARGEGSSAVGALVATAYEVSKVDDVRAALATTTQNSRRGDDQMDVQ